MTTFLQNPSTFLQKFPILPCFGTRSLLLHYLGCMNVCTPLTQPGPPAAGPPHPASPHLPGLIHPPTRPADPHPAHHPTPHPASHPTLPSGPRSKRRQRAAPQPRSPRVELRADSCLAGRRNALGFTACSRVYTIPPQTFSIPPWVGALGGWEQRVSGVGTASEVTVERCTNCTCLCPHFR